MGALFQFLSGCPWLQKIRINSNESPQDITLDQVVSLESLVELDYTCNPLGRILPHLSLPRLQLLQVSSSFEPGQVQQLTDVLPHGGHVYIAGTTEMSCYFNEHSQKVGLYGEATDGSPSTFHFTASHALVNRFFDNTWIPFRRIEKLIVACATAAAEFPIDIAVFENMTVLRTVSGNPRFTEGFLRLLYPDLEGRIPCRHLQEIQYPHKGPLRPLISLVRERERAGNHLRCVRLSDTWGVSAQDLVEKLKENVGEVRIEKWEV